VSQEVEAPEAAEVLDHMTDAFFALDRDWRFTYLNGRAETVLTRAMADGAFDSGLEGRGIWEVIPEAEGTVFADEYQRAMETGEPRDFEAFYDPLDTWFEVRVFPSESGLSVYFRDVTERKEREERAERTNDALRTLYRIAADREATFEEQLDRVLELGCEYLGVPYGFLTDIQEDEQTIVQAVGTPAALEAGASCPLSEAYCRKTLETDGLLAVVDAVEDGWEGDPAYERFGLGCYLGGKVVLGDGVDRTLCFAGPDPREEPFSDTERSVIELLTEWVASELERRQSAQRLERKNDRLERMASVISHDLINPLSVAKGRLSFLKDSVDEEGTEHVAAIEGAHERMESLLEDLSTLARQGEIIDERVSLLLGDVVEEAWATVPTADATLDVADEVADSRLAADESRLQQAFENLFKNAVQHGGETVHIEVGPLPGGFYVQDDGPGIPEGDREEVLKPGYTTDQQGSGLGVTIVREVVDAHGWSVAVGESPDGGARFEVTGVDRT
jgi:signal transduction histidine kinase